MAEKKTAAKKTATLKTAVKKTAAKTASVKKAVAKKAPVKKATVAKPEYTAEQVYSMIENAAYFAAQNDGYKKNPGEYWSQAEAQINEMVKR